MADDTSQCSDNLEARVKALVAAETGTRLDGISSSTRLAEEIGIDGDDAVHFFERFAKEFDVDLTEMQWHMHFSDEGLGCPVGCVFALIFGWSYTHGVPFSPFVPVTVGDLVEAAMAKRWVKKYGPDRPA